jgi:hypothetical protein
VQLIVLDTIKELFPSSFNLSALVSVVIFTKRHSRRLAGNKVCKAEINLSSISLNLLIFVNIVVLSKIISSSPSSILFYSRLCCTFTDLKICLI